MDFLLPHPAVRPSRPVKGKLKHKPSKLSLKDRLKTAVSCKENKDQVLQSRNSHRTKIEELHSGKDMFASLMSSDESDHEDKLLSDSTFFQGSQFRVPKAESTRLEINVCHLNEGTNPGSYFSCKSQLTQSSDSEPEGACEESIICLSDDDSLALPKCKVNPNIVIPESTESDSTVEKTKQGQQNAENKNKTIILESSSEDESLIRRHYVGKTVLSTLNDLSKEKQNQWKNIVIPTSSSCSNDSNDIIDSSHQDPGPFHMKDKVLNTSSKSSTKKKSHQLHRRKVILETSESENSVEDSEEISPRTLAAEKLSDTKANEIQRWIDGTDAACLESTGTESKDGKSSTPSFTTPKKQKEESTSSSDDSFDKLIIRDRKPKKTPKSSFIVDDSSSSSGSYSNYRRVLTNNIKKDVNDLERTPFGILTGKPTSQVRKPHNLLKDLRYSSETESDEKSSSSSDWASDFCRDKKRGGKPVKKPVEDTPKTMKKHVDTPRILKKPVENTPRTLKKPLENTPKTLKKPLENTPRNVKKRAEDKFETPRTGSKQGKVEELKKTATPYSPIRTFLTSLSGPAKNPNLRNHPEASIYYKNYKSKKEELARRLYKLFNREVFDNRLPDDMVLEWNGRMLSTAGSCSCKLIRRPGEITRTAKIVLSSKILDSADRLRDTLIHELCHAAVWLLNHISGGHGSFWRAWAAKAERRFPELPPITVCHQYQIDTKYTYKCVNCGYRHSKSIDLETKRCGRCYGKFELLVNKQGRSATATPATPKPPTGFALFVKENYGSTKKEHSDKKHGDIMKLLGQKFAEVKIGQGSG